MKDHSYDVISRVHVDMSSLLMILTLINRNKVKPSFPFHNILFGNKFLNTAHTQGVSLYTFLSGEYQHKLFEILHTGDLSPFLNYLKFFTQEI